MHLSRKAGSGTAPGGLMQASLRALEDANDSLSRVKADREWRIARLKGGLGELYGVIGTDPRERKHFPSVPSAATLEGLEREIADRSGETEAAPLQSGAPGSSGLPGTRTELSLRSPSSTRLSHEDLRGSAQTPEGSPISKKTPVTRRSPDRDRLEIARRSRGAFRR
jgi:hypothetical protein